ncbi:MAG: hypothetical protein OHK0047_30040 [Leptolyngbyaceae cyanobacterium]
MNFKDSPQVWAQVKQQAKVWRVGLLPGLVVVACVLLARITGSLQVLEWMAFDQLLKVRPVESPDPQVVIVGINEQDIKTLGKYPIPDQSLADALNILQTANPRAIGLDLFRDLTQTPDRAALATVFQNSPNLIGIEAVLGGQTSLTVKPPPELPPEQVGMVDAVLDADGKLRRGLLASKVDSGEVKYSMVLRLAALYLRAEGIPFQPGARASDPIYLGTVALPRFQANTGGYVGAKAGGNQILLNFRSHPRPFRILSLMDVLRKQFTADWIRDRVVLIGMTATSVNDNFLTSATQGTILSNALGSSDHYQIIYGVEYQAHAVSQLINAALGKRPLLQAWPDNVEYVWILLWGLLGITLGLILQSPWKTLFSLAIASLCLIGLGYGLLLLSWWVPLVPALLALVAAGLTTSFFDRDFRVLVEQRSLTLKRTYDAVHNGPLQTLAAILRNLDEEPSGSQLRSQLQDLNQELRMVYESMQQAWVTGAASDLNQPMDELLYAVYDSTLKRNLPGFWTIKTFIPPDFTPLNDCPLDADQKQGLCLFLEEALCNVGKYAVEATYLDVVCKLDNNHYSLQIIDNGTQYFAGLSRTRIGRGTDQARELARSLGGTFRRRMHNPQGTVCELTWKLRQPWWRILAKRFVFPLLAPHSKLRQQKSDSQIPPEF